MHYRLTVRDAQGFSLIERGTLSHLAARIRFCDYYPGSPHPTGNLLRERRTISSVVIDGPVTEGVVPGVDHTHHRDHLRDAAPDLLAACEMFVAQYRDLGDDFVQTWAGKGHEWARMVVTARAAIRKAWE